MLPIKWVIPLNFFNSIKVTVDKYTNNCKAEYSLIYTKRPMETSGKRTDLHKLDI